MMPTLEFKGEEVEECTEIMRTSSTSGSQWKSNYCSSWWMKKENTVGHSLVKDYPRGEWLKCT